MKLYEMYLNTSRIPQLIEEKSFRYSSKLRCCQDVISLLSNCFHIDQLAEERVYLIGQDSSGKVCGTFLISKGTANASYCQPREIFQRLFMVGATSFIIAHNHPSGDCTPSESDTKICHTLSKAGEIMNIYMNDFIIAGGGECGTNYFSYMENGMLREG